MSSMYEKWKYDVPFIGSDELPPPEPDDGDLLEDKKKILDTSNSIINVSLRRKEWKHLYDSLMWDYQINGHADETLGNILDELKKQLSIIES